MDYDFATRTIVRSDVEEGKMKGLSDALNTVKNNTEGLVIMREMARVNERWTCSLNRHAWRSAFDLAVANGWQPLGTEAPTPFLENNWEWDRSYFGSDEQVVIQEDATALADALEAALDSIPDDEPENSLQGFVDRLFGGELRVGGRRKDPFLAWAGKENKAVLQSFIDFCRRGAFTIH